MAFGVDTTSHATALPNTGGGASVGITWNHTCAASANKLVVTVSIGSTTLTARNVASVTYNGVALTQIIEQDDGNFEHSEIWRLNNPPTGSSFAILVKTVSDTGGVQMAAGAISFNDADAAEGTPAGATGTSTNPTVSVTSAVGDICVDAYATDAGGGSAETLTLIWKDISVAGGDSDFGSQRTTAIGSSTAMTWTNSGTLDGWSLCAVAIKASSVVAATPSPFVGSFGRRGGRSARYPL